MTVATLPLDIPERAFQAGVLDYSLRTGWMSYHAHDSRRQVRPGVFVGDQDAAGFPDWVFVRERIVFAELKARRGRLSPTQRRWIDALRAAGAEVYVWKPEHWPEIEVVLGRRQVA